MLYFIDPLTNPEFRNQEHRKYYLTMFGTKSKANPGSPSKDQPPAKKGSPSKRGSPAGRKSKKQVKQTKLAPGWYLRSCLLQGNIEVIFITTSSLVDDAYYNTIVTKLSNPGDGEDASPITDIGLMGAYYMRVSLQIPNGLFNAKSSYQRKAFVRVLDDGEDDPES